MRPGHAQHRSSTNLEKLRPPRQVSQPFPCPQLCPRPLSHLSIKWKLGFSWSHHWSFFALFQSLPRKRSQRSKSVWANTSQNMEPQVKGWEKGDLHPLHSVGTWGDDRVSVTKHTTCSLSGLPPAVTSPGRGRRGSQGRAEARPACSLSVRLSLGPTVQYPSSHMAKLPPVPTLKQPEMFICSPWTWSPLGRDSTSDPVARALPQLCTLSEWHRLLAFQEAGARV